MVYKQLGSRAIDRYINIKTQQTNRSDSVESLNSGIKQSNSIRFFDLDQIIDPESKYNDNNNE